jgi:hypothetical protein
MTKKGKKSKASAPPTLNVQQSQPPTVSAKTLRNRARRAKRKARDAQYIASQGVGEMTLRDKPGVNVADPRSKFGKLPSLGNTRSGSEWALKCLHPNGEGIDVKPKIPDGAASDSVQLERRDLYDVKPPVALFSGDNEGNDHFDLFVVDLPLLRMSTILVAGLPSTITDKAVEDVLRRYTHIENDSAIFPLWLEVDKNIFMSICQSSVLDSGVPLRNPTVYGETFKGIRRCYKGITSDYDAATLTDEGRVVSGQFPVISTLAEETTLPKEDAPTSVWDTYEMSFFPFSQSEITQQDSKHRSGLAKNGDYTPLRLWQPEIPFKSEAELRVLRFPIDEERISSGAQNIVFAGWGSFVCRWENVHKTTSIFLKIQEGLELTPNNRSPYGPFLTPGYPDDPRALSVVREFARTQPHSFEACFNEKNKMAKSILGGLGNVISNLGIPVVSDIAGPLGNLLGSIFF